MNVRVWVGSVQSMDRGTETDCDMDRDGVEESREIKHCGVHTVYRRTIMLSAAFQLCALPVFCEEQRVIFKVENVLFKVEEFMILIITDELASTKKVE